MELVTWSNSKINLGSFAQEKALFDHIFHILTKIYQN
jgi:hypothetical protein